MEDENNTTKKEEEPLKLLYIFILIVVLLWISAWVLIISFVEKADRGTFGDMFGGVNALFSGLALAGIIYTILLQKKELSLQREELTATRGEFITQNETLKQQRFENTLFQMINLHHEIIDKLVFNRRGIVSEKRACFSRAKRILTGQINYVITTEYPNTESGLEIIEGITDVGQARDALEKGYKVFYFDITNQLLSSYFRSIYHIFKFIWLNNLIEPEQKRFYASLVRAQLSSDELHLILYNSLITGLGKPNFLYLIRELDIMQNFDFDLIEFKYHMDIFNLDKELAEPEFEIN